MARRRLRLIPVMFILAMLCSFLPALVPGASAALFATVGNPVNVSAAAGSQAEATIAVDPTNPMRVFVASNPGGTAAFSTDGGATWTRYTIPGICCDNVATFDNFGNLFLVNLNAGVNQIDLYLSTTGGTTGSFTLLSTLDTGSVDQPTVAVGANSVWVTWNRSGTIFARGAAVTGLGAGNVGAFNAAQAATNSAAVSGQFGDIAIGPTGQVTVSYQSNTQIFVNTDADGLGAGGFGAQVTVTNMNVAKFDFIPAQSSRSIDSEEGLVYDRSGGPRNGWLYMVYTDEPTDENHDMEIMLRRSTDNGATWSAAVRVNDDATTRSQFLPHIALDQANGNLAIAWHDARNDSGAGAGSTNGIANDDAQFWGTFSIDGGVTYLPNFAISDGTSNANVAASPVDYGDYRWSSFVNGVFQPVWADNSNTTGDNPAGALSTFDTYTARIILTNSQPTTTVASGTANYGDATATLTATVTVTAGGAPVAAGGTVNFTLFGVPVGSAVTNASGVATLVAPLPPGTNAGTYPNAVHADYLGTPLYEPSSDDGPLQVRRRIIWVKPVDRTVVLKAANPPGNPNLDPACPAPSRCLELSPTRGSSFAPGESFANLNLAQLRFTYNRNPPMTNATEFVGKTYRITAFGAISSNYDIRYDPGTLTVVAAP
jgi:hypothetical protein